MSLWQKNTFCKFCFSLKQYCITKPFPCAVLFVSCVLWLATPWIIEYSSRPPVEYEDISQPDPMTVKAGDKIYITRKYQITRSIPVTLTRRIESGDCSQRCDRIDLPSSEITNELTLGHNVSRRQMAIPAGISPGKWVLRVYVNWTDMLGNRRSIAVPLVEFEVLP